MQTSQTLRVTIRAVHSAYAVSASSPSLDPSDDASVDAKLSGEPSVMTSLSDPLGLDEWNTTVYLGQHAVFSDLVLRTTGVWRLHASSPDLQMPALSHPLRVLPGPPVSVRIDAPDTPMETVVGVPLNPPVYVRLFDASGNNVTHENATARIELSLEPEPNLNGGSLYGNFSATATFGVAAFDNLRFDEASTLKRLTATGRVVTPEGELQAEPLANATSDTVRVLPGPATQLVIRKHPLAIHASSKPPVASARSDSSGSNTESGDDDPDGAGAAALALSANDGLPPTSDRIGVRVSLLDSFGNDVCNSLMSVAECPLASNEPPLAIALTLLHSDFINYTLSPLATATRTVSRRVVFANGTLGADFDNVRVYRATSGAAFNVSLITLPAHIDPEGVPLNAPSLMPVQTSIFDVLDGGTPLSMRFAPQPQLVYMSDAPWADPPKLLVLDVRGDLCAEFDGQVRLTVSGTPALGFFPAWQADGALVDIVNGTAELVDARALAKPGVPVRRGLRLVAQELLGHERLVQSVESSPFDVFDAGINQRLAFEPRVHPHAAPACDADVRARGPRAARAADRAHSRRQWFLGSGRGAGRADSARRRGDGSVGGDGRCPRTLRRHLDGCCQGRGRFHRRDGRRRPPLGASARHVHWARRRP